MKYLYGDSWERHPIKTGEVWMEKQTGSMVSVNDIRHGIPDYMLDADMVYVDPPWSQGNANSFITKAGLTSYINSFEEFYRHLFEAIRRIDAECCYVEIGKQNKDLFAEELLKIYPSLQCWDILYYKKYPCYLLRAGRLTYQEVNFDGMDDEATPLQAINIEQSYCVADPCMGRGLTAVAAYRAGVKFCGTELNPRRLAVAIDRVNKLGGKYEGPVS